MTPSTSFFASLSVYLYTQTLNLVGIFLYIALEPICGHFSSQWGSSSHSAVASMVSSVGPQPGWGKFMSTTEKTNKQRTRSGQDRTVRDQENSTLVFGFSWFALTHCDTYIGGKSGTMVLKVDHGLFAKWCIAHPDFPDCQAERKEEFSAYTAWQLGRNRKGGQHVKLFHNTLQKFTQRVKLTWIDIVERIFCARETIAAASKLSCSSHKILPRRKHLKYIAKTAKQVATCK
jgi:hypothetical protein